MNAQRRTLIIDLVPLLAIAAAFAALLAWRAGSITPSFDEMVDAHIASCHQRSDPFFCNADISQGRLPYLVHAAARNALMPLPERAVDLFVSGVAATALLLAVSLFVRREFGRRASIFAALLLAASAPVITAGRMAMTHSNVLFALFTACSLIAFVAYLRGRRTRTLILAAVLFGASVASNILGALTAVLFLFLSAAPAQGRDRVKDAAVFLLASVAAFFFLSPAHVLPSNIIGVLRAGSDYRSLTTNHNYLWLDANIAPLWYPFALFAFKLAPWWTAWFASAPWSISREKDRFRQHLAASLVAFIVLYLVLKALLRYDAPHHHVHVIVLACIVTAYAIDAAIARAARPSARGALIAALALSFALQAITVAQVFPNMLFYGAQFGRRFIGEFYGPAAIQCQDQGAVRAELRKLVDEGKDVRTMATVCWGAPGEDDLVSPWWEIAPHRPEEGPEVYVFGEWVLFEHFQLTEDQRLMRERVLAECVRHAGSDFPFLKDVYVIWRCPADPAYDTLSRLVPAEALSSP